MIDSAERSTPRESSPEEAPAPPSIDSAPTAQLAPPRTRPARPFEDLAVLVVALLLVILPGWLRGVPGGPARVERRAVEPIRLEINSAPWYHWTLIEGIGESRARAIVAYRESHGPFRSIDELHLVPRMPSGWVERARDQLTCEEK